MRLYFIHTKTKKMEIKKIFETIAEGYYPIVYYSEVNKKLCKEAPQGVYYQLALPPDSFEVEGFNIGDFVELDNKPTCKGQISMIWASINRAELLLGANIASRGICIGLTIAELKKTKIVVKASAIQDFYTKTFPPKEGRKQ